MTPNEINVAIAEACGWTGIYCSAIQRGPFKPRFYGVSPDGNNRLVPNFCGDLNACAEMVKSLASSQRRTYTQNLYDIVCGMAAPESDDWFYVTNATPKQRCETFLRSLGMWKETK